MYEGAVYATSIPRVVEDAALSLLASRAYYRAQCGGRQTLNGLEWRIWLAERQALQRAQHEGPDLIATQLKMSTAQVRSALLTIEYIMRYRATCHLDPLPPIPAHIQRQLDNIGKIDKRV